MKKAFDASAAFPLLGKTIVFTGALSAVKRRQAATIARELGATVTTAVSAKTDFVVAGTAAGKNLQEAANRNVKIVTEGDFFAMVKRQRASENFLNWKQ